MSSSDSSDSSFFSSFFSSAEGTKAVVSEAPCRPDSQGPQGVCSECCQTCTYPRRGQNQQQELQLPGRRRRPQPRRQGHWPACQSLRKPEKGVRPEQLLSLPDGLGLSPSASVTGSPVLPDRRLCHIPLPETSSLGTWLLGISPQAAQQPTRESGCTIMFITRQGPNLLSQCPATRPQ